MKHSYNMNYHYFVIHKKSLITYNIIFYYSLRFKTVAQKKKYLNMF
jgi:hypothetical protein